MRAGASMDLPGIAEALTGLLREAREPALEAAAVFLHQRSRRPQCQVTVVGETSTGKSTLINALLGRSLLPAFARPTTATVTHVACTGAETNRYFAIYQDATQEELDPARFIAQCESPAPELLRLQVRTRSERPGTEGLHVFDTPGFNSVMARHEEVLRQFLPQSDLIVFVCGYRTGFGQPDQELLELLREAAAEDPDLPVVLVVNRAPPGARPDARRVREIFRNAADCLLTAPDLVIVESVLRSEGDAPAPVLPEAGALWERVSRMVDDPARLAAVHAKLAELLAQLADEADGRLEQRLLLLRASDEEVRFVQEQLATLKDAEQRSLAAVDRSSARLADELPRSVAWHAREMSSKLATEIEGSEKWLGKQDCVQWLSGHALPFEVRKAGGELELQIETELRRLDQELQDIANTAVTEIQRRVQLRPRTQQDIAAGLLRRLLQRAAGDGIHALLRGIGGVGGAAAGAGNVMKMLIKRVGDLFGKTFSREVYRQIGKLFTKRALERLNIAVTVLVEVVSFVTEANRWKDEVRKRVDTSIGQWRESVVQDLLEQQLPQMKSANVEGVKSVYRELITQAEQAIEERKGASSEELEQLEALRSRLQPLRMQRAAARQEKPL